VPRFLTPEWIERFNDLAAGVQMAQPGPDAALRAQSGHFIVAEEILDHPDGPLVLLVTVSDATLRLGRAASDETADVTIALTYADARALAAGTLRPAEALVEGRIRVRGDLGVLTSGLDMLAEAQRHVAALQAETTY
jgi:alkyl sulfatase BDS1-like metallo-beta-lactamase superfamily hydrolase